LQSTVRKAMQILIHEIFHIEFGNQLTSRRKGSVYGGDLAGRGIQTKSGRYREGQDRGDQTKFGGACT